MLKGSGVGWWRRLGAKASGGRLCWSKTGDHAAVESVQALVGTPSGHSRGCWWRRGAGEVWKGSGEVTEESRDGAADGGVRGEKGDISGVLKRLDTQPSERERERGQLPPHIIEKDTFGMLGKKGLDEGSHLEVVAAAESEEC